MHVHACLWGSPGGSSLCAAPGCGKLEKCLIGAPAGFLQKFWTTLADEPWVREHPANAYDLQFGVPLLLHGDEGEYVHDQKCYVISLSGIAHGSSWSTRFLIAALPCDRMVFGPDRVNRSLQAVLSFVRWSFVQLLAGTWPVAPMGADGIAPRAPPGNANRMGIAPGDPAGIPNADVDAAFANGVNAKPYRKERGSRLVVALLCGSRASSCFVGGSLRVLGWVLGLLVYRVGWCVVASCFSLSPQRSCALSPLFAVRTW